MKKQYYICKKKHMKNISLFFIFILSLTSCVKFEQPYSKFTSIGGEYVIEELSLLTSDQSQSQILETFYNGDTFIGSHTVFPLDTVNLGATRWHISNSTISFNPVGSAVGQTFWTKEYILSRYTSIGNDEYLAFNVNGTVCQFLIVSSTLETLTLRSTGQWPFSSSGQYESISLLMTRIGP
jgi:hypothetical protein